VVCQAINGHNLKYTDAGQVHVITRPMMLLNVPMGFGFPMAATRHSNPPPIGVPALPPSAYRIPLSTLV
jgi:hypothetical protein